MRLQRRLAIPAVMAVLAAGAACAPAPLGGPGLDLGLGPGAWWLLAIPAALIIWFRLSRSRPQGRPDRQGPDQDPDLEQRLAGLEAKMQDLERKLGTTASPRPQPREQDTRDREL